jgi:protein involved in polysaccharide export with SLBB domain
MRAALWATAAFLLTGLSGWPGALAQDLTGSASRETAGPPAEGYPYAAVAPAIQGRIDPDTYRVGPGDEFAFRHSDLLDARIVRVSPEGAIFLPDAGAISVAGLSLRDAEAKVRQILQPYVRGKGLVFLLHAPRRFRLAVLGEVGKPGIVTLQAPARASEAIDAAGGIAYAGVLRGIEIRRGSDTLRVDLVRYSRVGDLDANPLVFETDILYVPAFGRRVEVRGAVAHPGRYDFERGDRLSTLVALAGGPLQEAGLADAVLERFADSLRTAPVPISLAAALDRPGGPEDVRLEDGDRLYLPGRANWRHGASVEVMGEVARPGSYAIQDGVDHLSEVIARAGGLTDFAEASAARIERPFRSAPRDSVIAALGREKQELLNDRDREWVLVRYGAREGLSADLGSLLVRGDHAADVTLLDGDRIVVPRRGLGIAVQGEVMRPGYVTYHEGWRAADYLKAAGGPTRRAHVGHARVTLASTGQQMDAGEAGMLRSGDVVWVPARPERSFWSGFKDLLSTASGVATVYLVIRQATK